MKWLIDENLNPRLYQTLKSFGYQAESSNFHKIQGFSNGKLLAWAMANGFSGLITRDKDYVQDSGLLRNQKFCVLILKIPAKVSQDQIPIWIEAELKIHGLPFYPGKAIEWP